MSTRARDFSRFGPGAGTGAGEANISLAALDPFLTTANVRELGNLYFTNARVISNLELASITVFADVDTETVPPSEGSVLVWQGNVWAPAELETSNLSLLTTDDLAEGNINLYYTNARARLAIGAANPTIIYDENTGLISANVSAISETANTTDGVLEGFINFYFTNARAFANLQQASIGDLRDVNLIDYPAANNRVIVYSEAANSWIAGDYFTQSAFSAVFAEEANTVLSISNFTTDDLVEGSNNLYFTNARAEFAVTNTSINAHFDVDTANNLAIGKVLAWTGDKWEPAFIESVGSVETALFSQFSNVANIALFTEFASRANFANLAENANFANVSGSTLFAENSNVAQFAVFAETANNVVNAAFAGQANTVLSISNFTTDDLAEGSNNLYYTDSRAYANIALSSINIHQDVNIDYANTSAGAVLLWNGTRWISNSLVGSAVASQFAERANIANLAISAQFAQTANVANIVLSLANLTTDDLAEGANNYYYTRERLEEDLQSGITGKDLNLNNLILDGDLTVNGNTVTLNVGIVRAEAKQLSLGIYSSGGALEDAGIVIPGANANITYSQEFDGFNVTKGLTVNGNLIPAIDAFYNLGSQTRRWKGIYLDPGTVFLGNIQLKEQGGKLVIQDESGNPASLELDNLSAKQQITVDRESGGEEVPNYIGGNFEQYVSGETGNLYVGILRDGDYSKFGGMLVTQSVYDGANTQSDVIFFNDKEGVNSSTARLSLLASGLITLQGDVRVNDQTLTTIARQSISGNSNVIAEYSNTYNTLEYDNSTGVITVSKDGVYEATSILTITEDWQDTPIKAAYIPTGTYVVQIKANDSAVGGGHTNEYYSGILSWYSDNTDSLVFDEIVLHRAGAGVGSGTLFLRILRTEDSDGDDLKLQIAGTTTNTGVSSYTFKFRRLL